MKDLLQSANQIQKYLSRSGIRSAAIGGLAVAIWGDPRLTRDVDLKILLKREEAHSLVKLLKPTYLCLSDDPEKTLREVGFLFIRESDGPRIDLLLADTSFDEKAIQRARSIKIEANLSLTVCTAEDLIIYKMISTRARDREDARGIIIRQGNQLDDSYILEWLGQFEKALDDSTLISNYKSFRSILST
ncbi:MAG: hypothetical protein HYT76_09655 [Deltaproteobacteria bacterium]|nr:hypothetical protein [Deltaproteobacteria bacterium]